MNLQSYNCPTCLGSPHPSQASCLESGRQVTCRWCDTAYGLKPHSDRRSQPVITAREAQEELAFAKERLDYQRRTGQTPDSKRLMKLERYVDARKAYLAKRRQQVEMEDQVLYVLVALMAVIGIIFLLWPRQFVGVIDGTVVDHQTPTTLSQQGVAGDDDQVVIITTTPRSGPEPTPGPDYHVPFYDCHLPEARVVSLGYYDDQGEYHQYQATAYALDSMFTYWLEPHPEAEAGFRQASGWVIWGACVRGDSYTQGFLWDYPSLSDVPTSTFRSKVIFDPNLN